MYGFIVVTSQLIQTKTIVTNGPKNFRRGKSSNADEDGCLFNRASRNWDLGFFWYSRKIKSTLKKKKNDGEGFGT